MRNYRNQAVVRSLGSSDFTAGAKVLANSFAEEPLFAHLLGSNKQERSRYLRDLMRGMLKGHAPFSEIDGVFIKDRLVGLSIAIRPDRFPLRAKDMLWIATKVMPAAIKLGFSRPGILRLFRVATVIEKNHPRDVDCWYLAFFGIDPAHRSGGVAKKLAAVVLNRADEQNLGCHLDTAGIKTMRMCRILGFEVRYELTPIQDGPKCYGMWRSPKSSA